MIHTSGVGFLAGIDIYDCVLVLNTPEAVAAFSKLRCTIGGELSATAGPVGMGGVIESEVHKRQAPIFTYMKSRGFYAGIQVDGTIAIERKDENERFYGERVSAADIVAGNLDRMPADTYPLQVLDATLRAAEGQQLGSDELRMLPTDMSPSDYDVHPGAADSEPPEQPRPSVSTSSTETDPTFGIPTVNDPDPYGVRALEQQGLIIREAGTQRRFSHEQFEFNPSPRSPVFANFSRQSIDARSVSSLNGGEPPSRRSSWRSSLLNYGFNRDRSGSVSGNTVASPTALHGSSSLRTSMSSSPTNEHSMQLPPTPKYVTSDTGTQCDVDDLPPAPSTPRTLITPPPLPPRASMGAVIPEDIPEEREVTSRESGTDTIALKIPVAPVANSTADATEEVTSDKHDEPVEFDPAKLHINDDHDLNEVSPTTKPMDVLERVGSPMKLDDFTGDLADSRYYKSDASIIASEDIRRETSTDDDDARSSYYSSPPSAGTSPAASIYNGRERTNTLDGTDDLDLPSNPHDTPSREHEPSSPQDMDDDLDLDSISMEPAEIVTVSTASSIQPATVATVSAVSAKPVSVSRAKVVNVPKRVAPALPPRNPRRGVDSAPMTPLTPSIASFSREGTDAEDSGEEKIEPPVRSPLRGRAQEIPATPVSATDSVIDVDAKEPVREESRGRSQTISRLTNEESRSLSPVPKIDTRPQVSV
jgi:hypothetical protein